MPRIRLVEAGDALQLAAILGSGPPTDGRSKPRSTSTDVGSMKRLLTGLS